MTKKEKLIDRLLRKPNDFRFDDLVSLLVRLGYYEVTLGRTSGSRRKFIHESAPLIILHEPHRGVLKKYQIEQIIELLKEANLI